MVHTTKESPLNAECIASISKFTSLVSAHESFVSVSSRTTRTLCVVLTISAEEAPNNICLSILEKV